MKIGKLGLCALFANLCLASLAVQIPLRHFDVPAGVNNGTSYFAENAIRGPVEGNGAVDIGLLAVVVQATGAPKFASQSPGAVYEQGFKVLASAVPLKSRVLECAYANVQYQLRRGPIADGKELPPSPMIPRAGLRPGLKFVALIQPGGHDNPATLYAAFPVEKAQLYGRGGGEGPFLLTLVHDFADEPLEKSEDLQWFAGMFFAKNCSEYSMAFILQTQGPVEAGNEALELAKTQDDDKRACLDFIAGRMGTESGYEPFFKDLASLQYLDDKLVVRLRILLGAAVYGIPHIALNGVLRGAPPTRTNGEMLNLAASFGKKPSLVSFLLSFVRFSGWENGLAKQDMIKVYLATDHMDAPDRSEVYRAMSDYFMSKSGVEATDENYRLRSVYPRGLCFPEYNPSLEADWKGAVDAYWGIDRKTAP